MNPGEKPSKRITNALLEGLDADLNIQELGRKACEKLLYRRFLGAYVTVIAIRNKAGVTVGYREGYTKSKLEQLARQQAKDAVRHGDPKRVVQMLREMFTKDPRLAKALVDGWPTATKEEQGL